MDGGKYVATVIIRTVQTETVTKMREILFRAKREDIGEWVYGYYVRMPDAASSVHMMYVPAENPDESNNVFYIDPQTVGQYTGLIDKNGIRIFEGDIVKVDDDFDTFGKMAGEIREVWFKDGGFRLKPKCASSIARGDRGYWMEDGADFEVIGNVWDNPELLGGDK